MWNGRGGKDLEKFIDKVRGHVSQQAHMSYILQDEIALLWLKHGDPAVVIKKGMIKKINPCLYHISTSQFLIDVVWLYGALQQSVVERG